jgi:radical SAM-linked protein
MMKIIVRASLPLKYTEGFNPKPKLVFAAPLSTGVESECEYMDIRLSERMPVYEAMARLNANMTEEMQAVEVYYPTSPLTDLKWLSYHIEMYTLGASEELAEKCNAALNSDSLEIMKKTKSGEALVDIKPLVKSHSVAYSDGRITVDCVLSADQSAFLNPEYIVKLLRERCGVLSSENITSECYTVMRREAFRVDMTPFN